MTWKTRWVNSQAHVEKINSVENLIVSHVWGRTLIAFTIEGPQVDHSIVGPLAKQVFWTAITVRFQDSKYLIAAVFLVYTSTDNCINLSSITKKKTSN